MKFSVMEGAGIAAVKKSDEPTIRELLNFNALIIQIHRAAGRIGFSLNRLLNPSSEKIPGDHVNCLKELYFFNIFPFGMSLFNTCSDFTAERAGSCDPYLNFSCSLEGITIASMISTIMAITLNPITTCPSEKKKLRLR